MQDEQVTNEQWIAYELSEIALGDERLNWRVIDTATKLALRPSASINQACADWADTKATYRLFANEKTTAAAIMAPHQQRTSERMAGQQRCLVLQDTTLLDYSHHASKAGLGPIGTAQQQSRGLVMHSALVTTLQGMPLGVLSQRIWPRDETVKQLSAEERRKLPIEEKESYKWLAALSESVAHKPAQTQLITIGDGALRRLRHREADLFELFHHAQQLETDLLIRAGQERTVCEPEVGLLWPVLTKQPVSGHLKVRVAKRQAQPERTALVAVRSTSLTLRPPTHLRTRLKPLSLYGLLVQEVDPPEAVEPLCWLLLTTVPVCSFDDAVERIQWYCQRWQIEILHKILKSGCQIEKAQLASSQRLIPLIALYSIIAWRLFWLTLLARMDPQAPATTILAPHELDALYLFLHKQPRPEALLPTVHQATLWIARLGGFLARKRDGAPGVTVIWRGWQRLADIAAAYLVFRPSPTGG